MPNVPAELHSLSAIKAENQFNLSESYFIKFAVCVHAYMCVACVCVGVCYVGKMCICVSIMSVLCASCVFCMCVLIVCVCVCVCAL